MDTTTAGLAHVRRLMARATGDAATYLRLSSASNPQPFDVTPGRLEVVARGADDVVVVAFGPMLWPALRAVEGRDVTLLYVTSLRPFDHAGLAALTGDSPLVIAVEPWYEGTAIATLTQALAHVPARYLAVGVPRSFIHPYGTREDLDRLAGLDGATIGRRIAGVVD
jgi:transketolase